MAELDSPTKLVDGIRRAQQAGYTILEAYTPYPMEEVSEALGRHRSRLPLIVLLSGIAGCLFGFLLQYVTAVHLYPLNVGGRPLNSWPAFIPVTFETTILFAAFGAVLGMFALCGLPQPYHPMFNVPRFSQATRASYFLAVSVRDPRFDREETRRFLARLDVVEVFDVEP
jgi:hypothetical protein